MKDGEELQKKKGGDYVHMTYNMSPVKDMCPGFTAELWAVLKSKDYTSMLFIHSQQFFLLTFWLWYLLL